MGTLTQCLANVSILSAPLMLLAFNPAEHFEILEVVGLVLWVVCWVTENVADVSKMRFVAESKKAGDAKTAVLGHPPYDGKEYRLWTLCRHPNYFCEWVSWHAFILMGIPSLLIIDEPLWIKIGFGMVFVVISRFFYTCLTSWTGAGPA